MYRLIIEKDAASDLRGLISEGGQSKADALKVLAFLEELKVNHLWLNELLTRKFANEQFDVDKFVHFWNQGLDIWRLKVSEFVHVRNRSFPLPLRIIYCYDMQSSAFRILGVFKREFDYDPNHEQTKRICRIYLDLGLPKHSIGYGNSSRHKRH